MQRPFFFLLIIALILSGCATLNKEECLTADWYQIGYEDGARGYADTRISDHREACAKHGITPDFRSYQDGHAEGVIRFCTARNGFERAQEGYRYTGVCPPALEPDFLDGYEAGREIYAVQSALEDLESEERFNDYEMSALQEEIRVKTNLMLAAETSVEQRYQLNQEIADMQQRYGGLEQRNRALISEIAETRLRLRQLRDQYAYF